MSKRIRSVSGGQATANSKVISAVLVLLMLVYASPTAKLAAGASVSPSIAASSLTLDQGQTANLTSSVAATGTPPYIYQWDSEAPNTTVFTPIADGTNQNYTFDSTGAALGNWSFEFQITDNTSTSVTSNVVSIMVNSPLNAPIIAVAGLSSYTQFNFSLTTVDQGQSANVYTSQSKGKSGTTPITYQWLIEPPGATSYSLIAGATSLSYWFYTSNTTTVGTWSFELEVTDKTNSSVNTNTVSVVVNAPAPKASPTPWLNSTLSSWPIFVGNITVGDQPFGVAYDSDKGELFVTNGGDDSVSVIKDSDNTVVATIPVSPKPEGIVYDSGKGEIFVANSGWNTVSVISDSTNKVVANITVGNPSFSPGPDPMDLTYNLITNPMGLAYDSSKGEIFVANDAENTVSVITDDTNSVIATIPVGEFPVDVAYDSGKGEIFVTNSYGNTVSVISDTSNGVVATITLPGPVYEGAYAGASGVIYDSGKSEIFVANSADNTISVISDTTNAIIKNILVGKNPEGLAYDSSKEQVFVTNSGSNSLSVISDNNNTVVATVSAGSAPWGVVVDSGKNELFVTNNYFYSYIMFVNISHAVLIFSNSNPLTAPSVSSDFSSIVQGQTLTLTSTAISTGIFPYKLQWYNKSPDNSSYSAIVNATCDDYEFATSNSTTVGLWSFALQVTDATGATVNSTATVITVNAPITPSPTLIQAVHYLSTTATALIVVLTITTLISAIVALLIYRRHGKPSHLKTMTFF